MTIEKAEEILDNMYQEKMKSNEVKYENGAMIDLSKKIEFTELEEASVRVLREELILKKKIEELKEEIDVQNEQIIALETVLEEKEKVIAIDKAMFEDSISKGQVAKNYIEKAKIENKIKELEEKYNYKFKTGELKQALIYQYEIKLLQELLEEE